MKMIQLTLSLTDELGIESIAYMWNDTELPSNAETLGKIALGILEAIKLNHDHLVIQDLLNDLNISLPSTTPGDGKIK